MSPVLGLAVPEGRKAVKHNPAALWEGLLRSQSNNLSHFSISEGMISDKNVRVREVSSTNKAYTINWHHLPFKALLVCIMNILPNKIKAWVNQYIWSFEIELTWNTNGKNISPGPFHDSSEAQVIAMSTRKSTTLLCPGFDALFNPKSTFITQILQVQTVPSVSICSQSP